MTVNHDLSPPPVRTVQDYIDERPEWSDTTPVSTTPMTAVQWRIWWLAAIGKFFEGYVVFSTGVALPLINWEFSLSSYQAGLVGAAPLAGILIGASALGGLADTLGRRLVFIVEMVIFAAFLIAIAFAPSLPVLIICLFGMGIALGADYPTAHIIITESIPSSVRGRLILSAFGFQAIGALFGVICGHLILTAQPDLTAWRLMYGLVAVPAIAVAIGRLFLPESAHWLMSRDRIDQAQQAIRRLLSRDPPYPTTFALRQFEGGPSPHHHEKGYRGLFNARVRRATILASVPWLLQDLATYGIGIFTPTIIASAIGKAPEDARNVAELVHNDILATKGAALLDFILIIGIICAILLADRVGRIKLQVWGFLGCAAGLAIAASSACFSGNTELVLIAIGFVLFNFMTNVGPNAQTYLLAGEVFPIHLRGRGAGFAASVGKIGAVATAFLFPVLLSDLGRTPTLSILVVCALLGALITWLYRIDTRGADLEKLHAELRDD